MAGPDILWCGYDGDRTVTASWDDTTRPAIYNLTVFDGDTPLQSATDSGFSGTVTLDRPLEQDNLQYTVAAAPGKGGKAYGAALPVIAARLADLTATLRGDGALDVAWTLPNSLTQGAHLRVADAQNNVYGSGWISGSAGVLTLGRPLEPTGAYTLYGAAGLQQSTGPEIPLRLVVTAPPLAALTYDRTGRVLTLKLSVSPPGGVRPGAVLFADDTPVATYLGDPGSQDITARLDAPLDAAVRYTVRPFLQAGAVNGPFGPPVAVLVSAPPVTRVRWVGANLDVEWTPLAAPPAPTGGLLRFTGPGSHPGPTPAAEATSWSGVPEPAFATGQSEAYTVTVANTGGVATGPMGEGLAVIVDTDALLSAGYDGTVARATWPTTGRPGATGARFLVLNGDSVVAAVDASLTAGGAAVAVALDARQSYTAALQWTGDRTTGPIGPRTALIAAAPTITRSVAGDAEVTLWWDPAAGPITGYQAILSAPGMPPAVQAATSGTAFPAPVLATPPLGLVAQVVALGAGAVTGPPSAPLRVVGGVTQVRSAQVLQDGLQVSWEAVPGAEDYTLLIDVDGAVQPQVVAGTSATMDLARLRGHKVTVAVAPGSGIALGRTGTAVPVTAPVAVTSVVTDPGTGLSTVSWPAVTGPDRVTYEVQLLRDGQSDGAPIAASSTHLDLGTPLVPGARQAVCVRALATTAGGGALTGPFGPPLALPVGLPAIEAVDYDGATALVRWRGVEGATGYAIDVVVDGSSDRAGHAEAGPADRQARVTVTPAPDPGKTWTVVLRALAGASSGPRATAPLVTPGLVPVLDKVEDTTLPRLVRTTTLAAVPQPITAYLPELGITAASVPANPPSGAPFVLAKNPDSATSGAYPYTLTIGGAALSFTTADRETVRTGYDALLKEAEALTPAMTPRAVAMLRDVIARLLPQTFAETLFYGYGLRNPGSAVDLRPGTILRVGSPPFQVIPGSKPPTYAQGYAAGAPTDFEIDDYVAGKSWLIGFDAFLSWLVANENLIVQDPAHSADWSTISGAADAADLYYPGLRRPFYRLFFPQYLQNVTDPALSQLTRQFTLLGADTYTAISGAAPGALPANVRGATFRGRSVLRVCIRIQVDGVDQVVPVGTTAGNVLDRLARRAPGTPPALRGVTLERALGAAVLDAGAYDAGAGQPVWLGWRGAGFAPGADVLSLPLLPGDRLRTGDPR